jgi:hypothetical protein
MRHHYSIREVTRDVDPAARAARVEEELAHLRLHARIDERGRADGGHIVEHFGHSKKPLAQYEFGPHEGAGLVAHLADHGRIKLPADVAEPLAQHTNNKNEEEEA